MMKRSLKLMLVPALLLGALLVASSAEAHGPRGFYGGHSGQGGGLYFGIGGGQIGLHSGHGYRSHYPGCSRYYPTYRSQYYGGYPGFHGGYGGYGGYGNGRYCW